MTVNLMDLVLVRLHEDIYEKTWLFKAPPYSGYLEKGMTVMCDTKYGNKVGEIVDRMPAVAKGSKQYNFVVASCKATEPIRKIIGYMRPVDYVEFLEGDE